MKILGLFNNNCAIPLFDYIESLGHIVVRIGEPLSADWCKQQDFDLAVSYTYKHIISDEVLKIFNGNAVNIHNSYLPYNRGAAPNLWSIAESTPRGVTLHYMDAQLDKGYIIAQKLITDGDGETLSSSYNNLDYHALELFKEAFKYYEFWPEMKKKALGKGTYHSVKDTKRLNELIDSYDMRIDDFLNKLKDNK
ncbi:MAG: hypothetical protein K6G63_01330 [Eubacterium sp.]|nr:hypothetical protein [Eubacterium sp.]